MFINKTNDLDSNTIILLLSLITIGTYLLDYVSHKIQIPSVLFLIIIGIILRILSDQTGFIVPYIDQIIPVLGTFALILIVLEGGLDLELNKEKIPIITKSLISSFGLIILSMLFTAYIFSFFYDDPVYILLVNSVPLAVISSAIAIPSVKSLKPKNKDFIIYESSFSDIIGIMIFNFILINSVVTLESVFRFSFDVIIIVFLSIILTLALSYLLSTITHHIKFFPILALAFLVYSIAKFYHLSPLIFILAFGLFLNNSDLLIKGKIEKYIKNDILKTELVLFKKIVAESTFVSKVFFFIIFGYSTDPTELTDLNAIAISALIVGGFFLSRYLFLNILFDMPFKPLTLIAPRGLITILLALSIPAK